MWIFQNWTLFQRPSASLQRLRTGFGEFDFSWRWRFLSPRKCLRFGHRISLNERVMLPFQAKGSASQPFMENIQSLSLKPSHTNWCAAGGFTSMEQ
jgi:hypothetical protein